MWHAKETLSKTSKSLSVNHSSVLARRLTGIAIMLNEKKKKYMYFSCQNMDMQKNAFQNFEKFTIHSSVFLFPVSNIAWYWEEVLITDIYYMETTSKRRKRWIRSIPKQNLLIIFITHSLFFQEVISFTATALFPSELPLGHLKDSLINGHSYKPNSPPLQN